MYKNFNLTEEEKQQILEQHQGKGYRQPLSEQPQLASVNSTRFATGFGADKIAALEKLALQNNLIKPGEKISDYFTGKDGLPTVTNLPDVTVSAKRIQPNRPPLPQVKANTPGVQVPAGDNSKYVDLPGVTVTGEKGPDAAIAGTKPMPLPQVNPNVPGVQGGASSVASGPTNSAGQGQQIHNMLMQKGLINGFADENGYENRRIVYKGAPLSQQQITTLTDYLVSKGYGRRFSQVGDKRYGQKLVWVKGGESPTAADLAA